MVRISPTTAYLLLVVFTCTMLHAVRRIQLSTTLSNMPPSLDLKLDDLNAINASAAGNTTTAHRPVAVSTTRKNDTNNSSLVLPPPPPPPSSVVQVLKNKTTSAFDNLHIAIFITTHMSNDHINFLRRCWPAAFEIVPMLTQSNCILFTTEDPPSDLYPTVFNNFHSFQMYKYENPGYHKGALLAMATAMDNNWFANFDWVIRVNADIVIRDDSFFRQVFIDPSIDAVFVRCNKSIQTDFFAFRPNSTAPGAFRRQRSDQPRAEPDTTFAFEETLNQTKRFRWLEGGHSNDGLCRVVGRDSPVIHDHDFVNQCPDLKTHHPKGLW